jgi:hypothetical protein
MQRPQLTRDDLRHIVQAAKDLHGLLSQLARQPHELELETAAGHLTDLVSYGYDVVCQLKAGTLDRRKVNWKFLTYSMLNGVLLIEMKDTPPEVCQLLARLVRLNHQDRRNTLDVLDAFLELVEPGRKQQGNKNPRQKRGPTVNERMRDSGKKEPDRRFWSSRKWAIALGCSPSTAFEAPVFKEWLKMREDLKMARKIRKARGA